MSLLNTHQSEDASERWQPHKTTLLSVFVSIQAMILGTNATIDRDLPPGSIAEKHVQGKTVYCIMLYWLAGEKAQVSA